MAEPAVEKKPRKLLWNIKMYVSAVILIACELRSPEKLHDMTTRNWKLLTLMEDTSESRKKERFKKK